MLNAILFSTLILNFSINILCVQSNNEHNNKQKNEDHFEQDLSDTFKIEGSDQGIQRVNLKCGADTMNVVLETEKPFSGVMYTRGSFYQQKEPCFVKSENKNTHTLEMNFQLSDCQTQQDGDLYSNIVVIQNDPELIMPGDSAFSLECDFRKSRSIDVGANFQTKDKNPQKLRGASRQRQ